MNPDSSLTYRACYGPYPCPYLDAQGLEEALRLAKKSGTEAESRRWKPCYLAALELQLRALLQMGRPADVISLADRGLEMADAMEYSPIIWRARSARAQALAMLGHPGLAAQEYEAAAAIIRKLARTISDPQRKRSFLSSDSVAKVLEHD